MIESQRAPRDAKDVPAHEYGWMVRAIRHYWWIVLVIPALAVTTVILLAQVAPYQAEVRASVLLPGDTEDPGNSERPEMMILDDLPSLVRSEVFAERVQAGLVDSTLSVAEVQSSLDASRYSRILTVVIQNDEPKSVSAIAASVEAELPALVNDYLVADGAKPATVNIIDSAGEPGRSNRDLAFRIVMAAAMGMLVGALIAIALSQWRGEFRLSWLPFSDGLSRGRINACEIGREIGFAAQCGQICFE